MQDIVKQLLSDKGTKSYRLVLVAVVVFTWQKVQLLEDIDRRLARLEARVTAVRHSDNPDSVPGGSVTVGPEWPQSIAAAFTGSETTR